MFTPLNSTEEKRIKENGYLGIKPRSDFAGASMLKEIFYCPNSNPQRSIPLFFCNRVETKDLFVIYNLEECTKEGPHKLTEPILHMFLGWIIQEAEKWAMLAGKGNVIIKTKLPHCTEWFIEHSFSLSDNMMDEVFRGFKKVKEYI